MTTSLSKTDSYVSISDILILEIHCLPVHGDVLRVHFRNICQTSFESTQGREDDGECSPVEVHKQFYLY